MTSSAEAVPKYAPMQGEDVYLLLAEVFGGSVHEGYWESAGDGSTLAEACLRLTDLLVGKLGVGPGDRVLDIGCGVGFPAIRLIQSTGASVAGITNSPAQIRAAVQNAADAGVGDLVGFQCADAMDLPFPAGSFDAVLSIESIFAIADRRTVLRQFARMLKPGGRLVLTDLLDRSPASATGRTAADELDERAAAQGEQPAIQRPVQLDAYESLLAGAGFVPVELADISEHTVARTFAGIRQRLTDDRDHLIRKFGRKPVEQYETSLPLLEAIGWGYGVVVATVAGQ
jgi:cyclopropane fatty-acyl-phospholipid synthase-like methyltransferase